MWPCQEGHLYKVGREGAQGLILEAHRTWQGLGRMKCPLLVPIVFFLLKKIGSMKQSDKKHHVLGVCVKALNGWPCQKLCWNQGGWGQFVYLLRDFLISHQLIQLIGSHRTAFHGTHVVIHIGCCALKNVWIGWTLWYAPEAYIGYNLKILAYSLLGR